MSGDESLGKLCHLRNNGWSAVRVTVHKPSRATLVDQEIVIGKSDTTQGLSSILAAAATAKMPSSLVEIERDSEAGSFVERTNGLADVLKNLSITTDNDATHRDAIGKMACGSRPDKGASDWYLVGEEGGMLPCHEVDVERTDESALQAMSLSPLGKHIVEDDGECCKELEEGETAADEYAITLERHLRLNPDQIIRYQVHGQPLWLGIPKPNEENAALILGLESAKSCMTCNAARFSEVQILSSLTSVLMEKYPKDQ